MKIENIDVENITEWMAINEVDEIIDDDICDGCFHIISLLVNTH